MERTITDPGSDQFRSREDSWTLSLSAAIFFSTWEEALLKSSQSLSPVVSDLGRTELAFEPGERGPEVGRKGWGDRLYI